MDDHEIDLRAFLEIVKRQFRIVFGITAGFLLVGAGVWLLSAPKYSATALIMVDAGPGNVLEPEARRMPYTATENSRVESEVEIIRSTPTLVRAIEIGRFEGDQTFPARPGVGTQILAFIGWGEPPEPLVRQTIPEIAARLDDVVEIRRRGETSIIAVTATAETPDGAARIANAIVGAHVELQGETKADVLLAAIDTLLPQLEGASATLADNHHAVDAFLDDNLSLFNLQGGEEPFTHQVEAHLAALSTASSLRADIARARSASESLDFAGLAQVSGFEPIGAIVRERDALMSRQLLLPFFGAQTLASATDLNNVQSRLEDAVLQRTSLLRSELSGLERGISVSRQDILAGLTHSALPLAEKAQLTELQRKGALDQEHHDQLFARVDELRFRVDLQQADSRMIAEATPPLEPSSRGIAFALSMAALLGSAFGLGAAVLRESFIGGVVSQEQLALLAGREVATSIPTIRQKPAHIGAPRLSPADAVINAPLSSFAESMRRLRLELDLRLPSLPKGQVEGRGRGRVIMVSSSVAEEGKTTTALGLARTYALSGQRVLLIDGDLRRPSLFIHLDVAPTAGLVDYLTGKLSPERFPTAIKSDSLSAVSAVVNTQPSAGPTDQLLVADGFRNLITAARDTFDVVIIDTPPLTEVVDGAYIMQNADAAVLLTRYAWAHQRDVLRAISVLENARPDMPPLVLAMTQHPDRPGIVNDRYVSHYVVVQ